MTSKDILALMECKRKYMLRNLSLKGQNERGICFQKALRICAKGAAGRHSLQEQMDEIKTYLENTYQEAWFLFSWQKDKVIQKELHLFQGFF